jgi:predicted enzyme related to lactoylglutathione lyase
MPETTKSAPGTFCWVEAATLDPVGNRNFYAALFGWHTTEMTASDGSPYFIADLGGKQVGGIGAQHQQARKAGASPRWLSYVAVADLEASTSKAVSLGATVLLPPHAMGPGQLSLLRDPTGAVLALWQSLQSMGTFVHGEPGSLGWNELATPDVDRARTFYTQLFDWRPEVQQMSELAYTTFYRGDEPVAGMSAQADQGSAWSVYFAVADADATFTKARALDARVLTPLEDIPGIGRYGFLSDPQSAPFAIIQFEAR